MGVDLYTAAQSSEGTNTPIQLLQQETYRCRLCQIRGGFRLDRMVHTGRYSGKIRYDTRRHPFAGVSEQHSIQEGAWADILLQAPLRPLEEFRTGEQSGILYYTVKEAMEKFKLSRDSVYGILQFHQINREKNGRFVRFLKVEFDRVMGVHK